MSPTSYSYKQVSHAATLETQLVQVDASVTNTIVLEEFGGDPCDTALLPLYANHVVKYVWN